MWSYRTFALIQVSPQRYKEWQHYSYRGKQYVPPNAHWFWKGYLAIGCPFKTAVHDCSLALTYSLRNMPQIICFKKTNHIELKIRVVKSSKEIIHSCLCWVSIHKWYEIQSNFTICCSIGCWAFKMWPFLGGLPSRCGHL